MDKKTKMDNLNRDLVAFMRQVQLQISNDVMENNVDLMKEIAEGMMQKKIEIKTIHLKVDEVIEETEKVKSVVENNNKEAKVRFA